MIDLGYQFQTGDRVVALKNHLDDNSLILAGDAGRVLHVWQRDRRVSVEWDKYVGGHDGWNDSGKQGYCWNVQLSDLAPEITDSGDFVCAAPGDMDALFS